MVTNTSHHLTKHYPNIKYSYVNVSTFFDGTPIEDLWRSNEVLRSQYLIVHTSDLLRLAVLWRYGGTYSDTDVIFLKPLMDRVKMPNFVAQETPDILLLTIEYL